MRRYIAILLCMVVAAGVAACQKTPESPIVIGKNLDRLLEKAQDTENMSEKTTQPRTETSEYETNIFIMISPHNNSDLKFMGLKIQQI